MKTIRTILELILIITIIILTISLRNNKKKVPDFNQNKPDTIYSHKSFQPIENYKIPEIPKLVILYHTDSIKITKVESNLSKITITTEKQAYSYSTQFLVRYPESSKLIQMLSNNHKLILSTMDTTGNIVTNQYKFYPEYYNYNYLNGKLTSNRKPFIKRLHFSSELMIRPVSNMYDINLGLVHNTRKIYYEVGLNTHYYPDLKSNIGFDPYVRLSLKF